jgi:hypothetical protein
MRKFILAAVAASIAAIPLAASVKAEDTTVIRRDDGYGDHKTIIKKHDDDRTYVAPREERKVIIHHDD